MKQGEQKTLLLIDPFCRGFEHATFNAAFIQTCLHAYPEDCCSFHGEASHVARVAELVRTFSPELQERITWKEIPLAEREWNGWRQFSHVRRLVRSFLSLAHQDTRAIVFTAARELDLLALKLLLRANPLPVPLLAILHGVLRTSLLPARPKPFSFFRGLRFDFRLPHPGGLRYLALGEPILAELKELVPRTVQHFRSIDLPYLWKVREPSPTPFADGRPLFGYLGVSDTGGFETFLEVVDATRRAGVAADFRMVGHVSSPVQRKRLAELKVDASPGIPSNEEYFHRARTIDFALWTIRPQDYRLTASTSFLESLSLLKPGIHLRNPYFDYYFARMGNIGYLRETPDEIVRLIAELCSRNSLQEYTGQCRTILANRDIFSPAVVGSRLREIISEMERQK